MQMEKCTHVALGRGFDPFKRGVSMTSFCHSIFLFYKKICTVVGQSIYNTPIPLLFKISTVLSFLVLFNYLISFFLYDIVSHEGAILIFNWAHLKFLFLSLKLRKTNFLTTFKFGQIVTSWKFCFYIYISWGKKKVFLGFSSF